MNSIKYDDNTPPSTPYELFANLYWAKQRELKKKRKINAAILKIWKSLSQSEKELFINKFKELQSKHSELHANYLLTTEPFLKKKHQGLPTTDRDVITESNCPNENGNENANFAATLNDTFQTFADNTIGEIRDSSCENRNEVSFKDETTQPSEQFADNTTGDNEIKEFNCENEVSFKTETLDDTSQPFEELGINTPMPSETTLTWASTKTELSGDLDSKIELQEQMDIETNSCEPNLQISPLLEPLPPTVKNGRQLFESLHCGANWFQLNKKEKSRYTSAATKLKNQYIKQYKIYLESLSSLELFNHYVNKS